MAEISDKELREIKQELANIKSVAMMKWPFFASLLRKCRIIADPDIKTAGVNIENEMRINPAFLKKLNDKAKIFIYGHEVGHIAFCQLQREGDKIHWIFNWAEDSVLNYLLFAHGFEDVELPIKLVTPKVVADITKREEKEIAKMETEGQYYLLEKYLKDKEPPFDFMNDLLKKKDGQSSSGGGSKINGKIIQEGDPQAYKPGMTGKEREKYWKDALVRAAIEAKMTGRLPAGVELIINNLLKAKVSWESVIKKLILNGFGKNTISTWRKSSRKHHLLPGIKQLAKPNLYLLIDTSGSTVLLMPRFLGETYTLIKNQGKGIIHPWDAEAYPAVELKRTADLAYAIKEKKIKGGGGTVITPVLKTVLESIKNGDIVVVITDGAISDIKDTATQELLRKLAQKSGQAVFASMDITVDVPHGWKKVKIEA